MGSFAFQQRSTTSSFDITYDDFLIRGKALSEILKIEDSPSSLGWIVNGKRTTKALDEGLARAFLGQGKSPLDNGRLPLYVCDYCGDYGCGTVSCELTIEENWVQWSNFAEQGDEYKDEHELLLLRSKPTFNFDFDTYRKALKRFLL